MTTPPYMPHGACWLWDPYLLLMHALGDLGTALYYVAIPGIAFYIYRLGHLRGLSTAYPALWRRGAAFVLLCGVNHLGAFLEIWFGGWIYYATGLNKILLLVASGFFAAEFWRRRHDLILLGKILSAEADHRKGLAGL